MACLVLAACECQPANVNLDGGRRLDGGRALLDASYVFIDSTPKVDPNDPTKTQVVQTSLFRWVPSITYNFKF